MKQTFKDEAQQRLLAMFKASKEGFKAAPAERHRLEGFMEAGVFLQLTTFQELKQLMESCHQQVFCCTIAERKEKLAGNWQDEGIDYSAFDSPAFARGKKK